MYGSNEIKKISCSEYFLWYETVYDKLLIYILYITHYISSRSIWQNDIMPCVSANITNACMQSMHTLQCRHGNYNTKGSVYLCANVSWIVSVLCALHMVIKIFPVYVFFSCRYECLRCACEILFVHIKEAWLKNFGVPFFWILKFSRLLHVTASGVLLHSDLLFYIAIP